MYKIVLSLLLLMASLLTVVLPAAADSRSEAAEIIALEIRNLATSIDRLTQLQFEQAKQNEQDELLRKLDIAVSYLNFRSRRIEMLERDKQNTQSTKNRLEDIIQQLEARIEQLEEDSTGGSDEKNQQAQNDTREQLKMLRNRLDRTDDKLIDFDNQITGLRNQLDDVEAFVERNLEL